MTTTPQREAYRIQDAVRVYSIPKTRLYHLMEIGRLPWVMEGRRRLILREDIERYLASLRSGTETGTGNSKQNAA